MIFLYISVLGYVAKKLIIKEKNYETRISLYSLLLDTSWMHNIAEEKTPSLW